MLGRGIVRAVKRITLFIIRITKSLENSGVLINAFKQKNKKRCILWYVIMNYVASKLGNMLTGKEVMRPGKGFARADQCSVLGYITNLNF